jgi:PilZ domain
MLSITSANWRFFAASTVPRFAAKIIAKQTLLQAELATTKLLPNSNLTDYLLVPFRLGRCTPRRKGARMDAPDQRRYPRVKPPQSVVVAWQAGTRRGVSFVDNICVGGLFVRTKESIPLRSLIQILLDLPVGQVRARAIVRRVLEGRGIAVEFIAMDPSDRARLLQQVKALLPA